MLKKFCDGCGREIVPFEESYYLRIDKNGYNSLTIDDFRDLCSECCQNVLDMLGSKRNVLKEDE